MSSTVKLLSTAVIVVKHDVMCKKNVYAYRDADGPNQNGGTSISMTINLDDVVLEILYRGYAFDVI